MQKASLIPTPLFQQARPPVQIAEAFGPGRYRLLRIVGFILSVAWLWWRTSFALRFTGQPDTRASTVRLRRFLERMGGLWIKAGQVVAMRRDLFMPETCDELSKLQDNAQGFPFFMVRKIIEEDFGRPLESLFSEFNEAPIAAASIGQTHVARLRKNGIRVAVKVQRPFVAQSFERDLRYLKFVISVLSWFAVAPQARLEEMIWELEKALTEELDYRMEASTISQMKKTLRKHKVYVPKVFFRCSSRRVLTMEFIEGVFMSDYIKMARQDPARLEAWLAENNIDPKKVGERLILSHARQMFEDNLYHGDLHPGNILLQRDSRFALIDFGSIGSFDKGLLQKYRMMYRAVGQGDFQKVADLFLLMCPPLPNQDLAELKAEIIRALRVWQSRTAIKHLPYHEKSLSSLFGVFAQVLRKYSIPSNWEFLRINRSDLTMDASIMFLFPELNYVKLNRKYEAEAQERAVQAARSPKAAKAAFNNMVTAGQLPMMLAEHLYFEAEWQRKRGLGFQGKIGAFAQMVKSVLTFFAVVTVAASGMLSWQYLHRDRGRPELIDSPLLDRILESLPTHGSWFWVWIAVIGFYLARWLVRLRHNVAEKEYDRPGR